MQNMPEPPGGGGYSIGGEGGGAPCAGPYCLPMPCCNDIDLACEPFDGTCGYCSRPEECLPGSTCDPLTHRCLSACRDHFECPNHSPLCDAPRGVCVQCYEDLHCPQDGMQCRQGFCILCDNTCG